MRQQQQILARLEKALEHLRLAESLAYDAAAQEGRSWEGEEFAKLSAQIRNLMGAITGLTNALEDWIEDEGGEG